MGMQYVKYEWPFSMIHKAPKGDKVRLTITLAVDPALEGLAAAFYMDGSGSMQESGNYGSRRGGLAALLEREKAQNPVSEAMKVIVPYIAGKDSTGTCLTAYWAVGDVQKNAPHEERWRETVQVIGDLTAEQAAELDFRGPDKFGNSTHLLPPVRHFSEYVKGLLAEGEDVQAAVAFIVTDGKFHDLDEVMEYSLKQLGPAIMGGDLPRINLSIVGIGSDVDETQMATLMDKGSPPNFPSMGIWSFALASTIDNLSEIVSHLVDKTTPAFWGGATIKDDKGSNLAAFEDMVPAVIELEVPADTVSFTLHVGEKSFTKLLEDIPMGHMGGTKM